MKKQNITINIKAKSHRGKFVTVKGSCFVETKGFDAWLMFHLPWDWYFRYRLARIKLHCLRFKMIFGKDHRIYEKDRLLFWKKPRSTGGLWA